MPELHRQDLPKLNLPKGFRYAGHHCGIKPAELDLSLIICDQPATAAGVYTQNQVRASSIDWNRSITPSDRVCGVIINSGNANACTGEAGITTTRSMAVALAIQLAVPPEQILVLSTGVIGQTLPIERIEVGCPVACEQAESTAAAFVAAAQAIQTTDRFLKTASRQIFVDGQTVSIAGMAKGAGMIGPNMATLLGILTLDCQLSPEQADQILRHAVDQSFNRITVEGHTSTNDAILLLSSRDGVSLPDEPAAQNALREAVTEVCIELAKMIPTDGEGASHLIQIEVSGAGNQDAAETIARTIAASALVKTAVTGADPNWGRIVSAAGYAGPPIELDATSLWINGHLVFENGQPIQFDEPTIRESMSHNEVCEFRLVVGHGTGSATHWTSDLTVDYVRLNSEYTT